MIKSKRFQISGTVQGVGFRPWVYRLAHQLHLKGFVQNTSRGVCMEIEGSGEDVDRFVDRIQAEAPVHCVITKCDLADIAPQGFKQFKILTSYDDQQHQAIVLPDMASRHAHHCGVPQAGLSSGERLRAGAVGARRQGADRRARGDLR